MAELRALVVDDEPLARRGIRQLLVAHPDITVAREARDGREALEALTTGHFDLVFLDVQMPGVDGFAVVRNHGVHRMPLVVFVTAHDQFAVRAFDAQALDYLVKPISAERFDAAITRVRERLRLQDAAARAHQLAALVGAPVEAVPPPAPSHKRVPVTTSEGQLLLDPEEIDWIEADDYHATIHTRQREYRVRSSLATLEGHLDASRFVRTHRSALVALDRIRELVTGEGAEPVVVLRNGMRIPVSRRRLPGLRRRIRLPARRN